VIPEAVTPKAGARVMDLQDPRSKMSKSSDSDAGCIMMLDPPAVIMKKFKRAVTDSESEVRYDVAAKPGVSSLLDMLAAATGRDVHTIAGEYTQYGPLKNDTGEAVVALLEPIQQRYHELIDDKAELARLLHVGAERATAVASATLQRAYDAIGLLPA
jgi:tryptophanyl-tRNA synthetase